MLTIRRILCPTDFSECSRRALAVAANLAAQFGAELTVAHACYVWSPVVGDIAALAGPVRLDATDYARFDGELWQLVEPARRRGIATRTMVVEGDPCVEIPALAESLTTDMVVMGTHGRGGLHRLLLGSVAETVLRTVGCPVVTLAEGAAPQALGEGIKSILCAESLSGHSRTLEYALSLARHTDARLLVLHAVEELPPEAVGGPPPFEYGPSLVALAAERLRAMIPAADLARGRTEVAVALGPACDQILLRATRENPDLIVLGVRPRNTLDLAVWGSTTRQIVRRAGCAVLTVPGGVRPAWAKAAVGEAGALGA
jgi:nucleotide-binding universal stress UspA family protein